MKSVGTETTEDKELHGLRTPEQIADECGLVLPDQSAQKPRRKSAKRRPDAANTPTRVRQLVAMSLGAMTLESEHNIAAGGIEAIAHDLTLLATTLEPQDTPPNLETLSLALLRLADRARIVAQLVAEPTDEQLTKAWGL